MNDIKVKAERWTDPGFWDALWAVANEKPMELLGSIDDDGSTAAEIVATTSIFQGETVRITDRLCRQHVLSRHRPDGGRKQFVYSTTPLGLKVHRVALAWIDEFPDVDVDSAMKVVRRLSMFFQCGLTINEITSDDDVSRLAEIDAPAWNAFGAGRLLCAAAADGVFDRAWVGRSYPGRVVKGRPRRESVYTLTDKGERLLDAIAEHAE